MSDIHDARDLTREGHLNTLRQVFREPSRMSWSLEESKQLEDLYAIALLEEPEDPVGWIIEFNSSHPYHIEVGVEQTRLGKMLYMAKIFVEKKNRKEQKKNLKREF